MVEFSKLFGQRETSRLFCISQKRICDWNANVQKSQKCDTNFGESLPVHVNSIDPETPPFKKNSAFSKGYEKRSQVQVADVKIEEEVFNWAQSQKPAKVTSTQIRDKARELYRQRGHTTKIQFSYGWYRRWCKRFSLSTSPHDSIDDPVLSWLLAEYDNNNLVTYKRLQAFTHDMMNRNAESGQGKDFKASQGWATRFFKRNHLLINWQGHYNKDLPGALQISCQEFLHGLNAEPNDDDRVFIAMDEIPLSFASIANPGSDSQIASTDGKISRLRKISVKNCEATVKLAVRNNGEVLSPMIVVKGQKSDIFDQVYTKTDNPVVVYYSKSTEPTVNSLEKWLDLIVAKELPKSSRPSILLWDSYSLHSQMSEKCKKLGIESRIFPAGCSCKLQPVNVTGRQLLLKSIDEEWAKYIKENDIGPHSSRISLPSTDDIVDWVYKAFKSMENQKELLRDSFQILKL